MDHTLAIDFGTSNSSVYIYTKRFEILSDTNGNYLFASCVEYVGGSTIVGSIAKKNLGRPGKFVVANVKRLIGLTYDAYEAMEQKDIFGCDVVRGDDGFPWFVVSRKGDLVNCIDVASEIFKEIKNRADLFCAPLVYDQAYLTVPADFSPQQCNAIKQAAARAGLTVKKLIAEPTAAALSYVLDPSCSIAPNSKMIVYDFGGGTFDASLLMLGRNAGIQILGEEGDSHLGGNDIDLCILEYVKSVFRSNYHRELIPPSAKSSRKNNLLKDLCELAKMTLQVQVSTDIDLSDLCDDVDYITLTRSSLDRLVEPLVERTMNCVMKALEDNQLLPGYVSYVFLVGGSSKLTSIRTSLQSLFDGACQFPQIDPDHCVALGAMRLLQADCSNQTAPHKVLSSSYGLGLGDGNVLIMLKKGCNLPLSSRYYSFSTTEEKQKSVHMKIFQYSGRISLKERFSMISEKLCHHVYDLEFPLSPQLSSNSSLIDIEFLFDLGGVLTVRCFNQEHKLLYSSEFEPIYGSY